MRRRIRWRPPVLAPHEPPPISSAISSGKTSGWLLDPKAHITVHKPKCGVHGCRELAMVWQRCRCRETFARCHEHEPQKAVQALRAEHRCAA